MSKTKTPEYDISVTGSNNHTEFLFGEKPCLDNLYEGQWHPTYRYKKLSRNAPYYPVLKIIHPDMGKITDIEIIFRSMNPKNKKDPAIKAYNWANPYFWIESGFYPTLGFKRIYDYLLDNVKKRQCFPVIEEDFGIIFDDIWKICVTNDGSTSIDRVDFGRYIHLIRILIENTLVFPINEINDYAMWEKYIHEYRDDTYFNLFSEEESEKLLKGWQVTKDSSPKEMRASLVADIKTIINCFYEKIKPDNGLGIFLNKIYRSYSDELVRQKLFIKCAYCGQLAEYLKGKKYCSLSSDGRDCGKSARNRRYYATTGQKRLPKYRKTTKELRAFYKEKGVKK
jgi:hypothetical protein